MAKFIAADGLERDITASRSGFESKELHYLLGAARFFIIALNSQMAIILSDEQPVSSPINEKATAIARFTLADPLYQIRGDALFVSGEELRWFLPEFGMVEEDEQESLVRKCRFNWTRKRAVMHQHEC